MCYNSLGAAGDAAEAMRLVRSASSCGGVLIIIALVGLTSPPSKHLDVGVRDMCLGGSSSCPNLEIVCIVMESFYM